MSLTNTPTYESYEEQKKVFPLGAVIRVGYDITHYVILRVDSTGNLYIYKLIGRNPQIIINKDINYPIFYEGIK
jgi:hypothetical protein